MASLNKVELIGHVGRDPELRHMPSGEAVTSLAVATSEKWKDKTSGEAKELTEWHRVSMFGKLAEIAAQYVKKGSLVYIEGQLRTKKWTDKDGIERYATEIKASQMQMLDRKDGSAGPKQSAPAPAAQAPAPQQQPAYQDDDIPF